MNIKSANGFTVMDISISIAILFIFVSLIAILIYNFNSTCKEIELKSEALEIAIDKIEEMKTKTIDNLPTDRETFSTQEGFTGTIEVIDGNSMPTDSADIENIIEQDFVKKVTVKVEYKFKKETKTIELSTIISKEK